MAIVAIDTNQARIQSKEKSRSNLSLAGADFSTAMNAAGATAGTALALQSGHQPAAVTQAAISGIAGAPGAFGANPSNAPYYGGLSTASPFSGGGYSYGGVPFGGGYAGAGAGVGAGVPGAGIGAGAGIPGSYGGWSSAENYEKSLLFDKMNDANWEMLMAQITVNEISRDYQARSNILKTKSDTELNAVRNMRA